MPADALQRKTWTVGSQVDVYSRSLSLSLWLAASIGRVYSDDEGTRRDKRLFERPKSSLLVCQWNVNSITTHVEARLNHIVRHKKPDVFCISELKNKWHEADCDARWSRLTGYNVYHMQSGCGKVATAVRADLSARQILTEPIWNQQVDREIAALQAGDEARTAETKLQIKDLRRKKIYVVLVEVWSKQEKWLIYNFYRSQGGTEGEGDEKRDIEGCSISHIQNFVDEIAESGRFGEHHILLTGDFNVHHTDWSSKTTNPGIRFNDWRLARNLLLMNDGSTTRVGGQNHSHRTSPDVTLCSAVVEEEDWWVEDNERGCSDHFAVFVLLRRESDSAK